MVYCSVALCQNGNCERPDLSNFRLPTDKQLSVWLKFCHRADRKFEEEQEKAMAGEENNLRICSEHFTPDSYRRTLNGKRILNDSSIPTIFRIVDKSKTTRSKRYEKLAVKRRLAHEFCAVKTTKKGRFATNTSSAELGDVCQDHTYADAPRSNHVFYSPLAENARSIGTQTDVGPSSSTGRAKVGT